MPSRIVPRAIFNTAEEIELGKVVHYKPALADGIALIADANGFTTLNAVARLLNCDLEGIRKISELTNEKNQCYAMPEVEERTLIFSPIQKDDEDPLFNIMKVMGCAEFERISILNYTNYNLIKEEFPVGDIECVLRVMNTATGDDMPNKIIFDIDARYLNELNQCLRDIGQ